MPGIGIIIPRPGGGPVVPPALHSAGVDGYIHRYVASRFTDLGTLAIDGAITTVPDYGSSPIPLAPNATGPGVSTLRRDGSIDYLELIGDASTTPSVNLSGGSNHLLSTVTAVSVCRIPAVSTRIMMAGGLRVEKAANGKIQVSRGGLFGGPDLGAGWSLVIVSLGAGGAVRVRINNDAALTGTLADGSGTTNITVGGNGLGTLRHAHIAEQVVYSSALSPTDEASVYAAMKAEYPALP